MVVFTGVSGSGKSSLAFDTIFAEGQRHHVSMPYAKNHSAVPEFLLERPDGLQQLQWRADDFYLAQCCLLAHEPHHQCESEQNLQQPNH